MKMNMMTAVLGAVLAGSVVTAFAAEHPMETKPAMTAEKPAEKAAMTKAVFVCPDCHTMAMKAGKCPMCEKELTSMHVLGTKDGQAMLCTCAAGCKCDAKGMKDGKCACGMDVKTMSAKGMYVCDMGCPDIADKAGKCKCGMDMKKVE